MANKAAYKYILRNKSGAFSTPRYARTFEIRYGKRTIIQRSAFPADVRSISAKKEFIQLMIFSIEEHRLKILQKARLKRQKEKQRLEREQKKTKKKKKGLKLNKEEEKRRISQLVDEDLWKKAQQITKNDMKFFKNFRVIEEFSKVRRRAAKERPNFVKSRELESNQLTEAVIKKILAIDYEPFANTYKKELIQKFVIGRDGGREAYHNILNYSYEGIGLEIDDDNMEEVRQRLLIDFGGHIGKFFNETKEEFRFYYLRIKFSRHFDVGEPIQQGISILASEVKNVSQLMNSLNLTLYKMGGSYVPGTKVPHTKNYLATDSRIFITGFTLDASAEVKKQ